MPNVSDRKLKLLYLLQMLWEGTDSQHALTLPQMLEGLEARGIQAERKASTMTWRLSGSLGCPLQHERPEILNIYFQSGLFPRKNSPC